MSATYEKGEQEKLEVKLEDSNRTAYRRPNEKEIEDCRPCRLCMVSAFIILLIGLLVAAIVLIALSDKCAKPETPPKVDSSIVYQINVRAFADSDNDGVGDFNGTTGRVEYIRQLGVNKIILNNVISHDDFNVSADLGTLDDLKNLLQTFHSKNIKVLLNFQPITVSKNNQWFIESKNNFTKRDWFIWELRTETNNWKSVNNSSAWHEVDSLQGEAYYSYFGKDLPALNYNNNEVISAMVDVLKTLLSYGFDGFFFTTVSRLAVEEILLNNTSTDVYDQDTNQSHIVLEQFYKVISSNAGILYVSPNTKPENMMLYLGSREKPQSDLVVNDDFAIISTVDVKSLNDTFTNLGKSNFGNIGWLTGGNGYQRFANRIANIDERRTLVLFTLLLPHSVLMFYGDEVLLNSNADSDNISLEWIFSGTHWLLNNSAIDGFSDLAKNRSSLVAFQSFPSVLYAENHSILLLYNKNILVGGNFGAKKETINGVISAKSGKYLSSTIRSAGQQLDFSIGFELDGFDVFIIELM